MFTVRLFGDAGRLYALAGQVIGYGISPIHGEAIIVFFGTLTIGVTLDQYVGVFILFQNCSVFDKD